MSKFKFMNVNPLGLIEQDCVCRAISLALDVDYKTIERKLESIGFLFDCEKLCVCCYKFLLDDVYNLPRVEEFKGLTVEDFISLFPKGIYLIRVDEHLTCVIDGEICDTWDCGKEIVHIVWEA